MKPDRYQHLKKIFLAAADLESGERAAYLDDACGEDKELRAEVESLLAENETVGIFDPTIKDGSVRSDEDLPSSIGPYRIVSQIGRGGMGVVFLGVREDGQFKRRVAIKVVKKGMDTEEILARFDLERQLLASLNHANIARLYEGDVTEDGRPYFVLEFIDGLPIDQYCDNHRLTIKERLELFATVCEAVQYAHQNLVVHRDIKPGNILVTEDGTPKLLDFGIAKLLNPELSLLVKDPTAPALRLMTPEYASPEQVRGTTISTASDVYSLGVLLYELLTGHRPYRITSHLQAELERIICEVEPDKPSTAISQVEVIEEAEINRSEEPAMTTRSVTPDSVSRARGGRIDRLRKQLAGDLDNIIFMAMRKEPQRRYSSAKQLAEDIQRHLDSLPVIARPDNLTYRFNKFMHRNRGPVTAAAIVFLSLVAGIMTTYSQWRIAETERDHTEVARRDLDLSNERARRLGDRLTDLYIKLMTSISVEVDKSGATAARRIMVEYALDQLESSLPEVGTDDRLLRQIASMYVSVGDVQGGIRNGNLGNHSAAAVSYEKSLSIRNDLADRFPGDNKLIGRITANHLLLKDVLNLLERHAESKAQEALALDRFQSLPEAAQDAPEFRRLKAVLYLSESDRLRQSKLLPEALQKVEDSLRLREKILDDALNDDTMSADYIRLARRDVSTALGRRGYLKKRLPQPQLAEALTDYLSALDIRQKLHDEYPDSPRARRDLGVAHENVALTLDTSRKYQDATIHYELSRTIFQALHQEDGSNIRSATDYARGTMLLGDLMCRSGRKAEGRPLLDESVIMFGQLAEKNSQNRTLSRYRDTAQTLQARCQIR